MNTLHVASLGQGPNLVLLHGWGMHGGVWAEFAQRLGSRFRVHCVDLPGYGDSAMPECWTLDAIAATLDDYFPKPVHVCGWSLGGLVGAWWAQIAPAKIRRLIGIGVTPCFVQRPDWPDGIPAGLLEAFAQDLIDNYRVTLLRFLALEMKGDAAAGDGMRQLRKRLFERPLPETLALQAGLRVLQETDARPLFASLQQPSLFVFGEQDKLVRAQTSVWYTQNMSEAQTTVFAGCGHAPFLSAPAALADRLTAFCHG